MDFVAADMPHANRLTVGIIALVAEEERHMISARNRRPWRPPRSAGPALGGYRGHTITAASGEAGRRAGTAQAGARMADLIPVLDELRAAVITGSAGIAGALDAGGFPAAGGGVWAATQAREYNGKDRRLPVPRLLQIPTSMRRIAMGLTAFIVFVVPWMLLAAWLFTLPSAIRLGAPSTPWRPLYNLAGPARGQQREVDRHNRGAHGGSGTTSGYEHGPISKPEGGALGTSAEPTEPDDKI